MPKTAPTRVALITGSTSGIGKAIAEKLASEGFTIAFHSRTSVSEGKALASATLMLAIPRLIYQTKSKQKR